MFKSYFKNHHWYTWNMRMMQFDRRMWHYWHNANFISEDRRKDLCDFYANRYRINRSIYMNARESLKELRKNPT